LSGRRWRSARVPVVYVEFPETDHGFDVATSLNPAGRGGYLPVESRKLRCTR